MRVKHLKAVNKRWGVAFVVIPILLFTVYKISDEFMLRRYAKVEKYVVETEEFRNPKMDEDVLYQIRVKSDKEDADFVKVMAVVLQMNQFDLQGLNVEKLNIERVDRIYRRMVKSDGFEEYYFSLKAVLGDVECFPVAFDKSGKYSFAFEDSFGSARSYNGDYSHEGTDIMAGTNESGLYPIVSVSDGVVENVGWLPKGGYRIGIRGNNGGYFYYAHLDKEGIAVKEGEKVNTGQILGYMGDTGYGEEGTTGMFPVHLHFGIYIKTKNYEELSINPYYILRYLENFPISMNYPH